MVTAGGYKRLNRIGMTSARFCPPAAPACGSGAATWRTVPSRADVLYCITPPLNTTRRSQRGALRSLHADLIPINTTRLLAASPWFVKKRRCRCSRHVTPYQTLRELDINSVSGQMNSIDILKIRLERNDRPPIPNVSIWHVTDVLTIFPAYLMALIFDINM